MLHEVDGVTGDDAEVAGSTPEPDSASGEIVRARAQVPMGCSTLVLTLLHPMPCLPLFGSAHEDTRVHVHVYATNARHGPRAHVSTPLPLTVHMHVRVGVQVGFAGEPRVRCYLLQSANGSIVLRVGAAGQSREDLSDERRVVAQLSEKAASEEPTGVAKLAGSSDDSGTAMAMATEAESAVDHALDQCVATEVVATEVVATEVVATEVVGNVMARVVSMAEVEMAAVAGTRTEAPMATAVMATTAMTAMTAATATGAATEQEVRPLTMASDAIVAGDIGAASVPEVAKTGPLAGQGLSRAWTAAFKEETVEHYEVGERAWMQNPFFRDGTRLRAGPNVDDPFLEQARAWRAIVSGPWPIVIGPWPRVNGQEKRLETVARRAWARLHDWCYGLGCVMVYRVCGPCPVARARAPASVTSHDSCMCACLRPVRAQRRMCRDY